MRQEIEWSHSHQKVLELFAPTAPENQKNAVEFSDIGLTGKQAEFLKEIQNPDIAAFQRREHIDKLLRSLTPEQKQKMEALHRMQQGLTQQSPDESKPTPKDAKQAQTQEAAQPPKPEQTQEPAASAVDPAESITVNTNPGLRGQGPVAAFTTTDTGELEPIEGGIAQSLIPPEAEVRVSPFPGMVLLETTDGQIITAKASDLGITDMDQLKEIADARNALKEEREQALSDKPVTPRAKPDTGEQASAAQNKDRLAIEGSGNSVEPYSDKVKAMQQALVDLDPAYEEILSYQKNGEKIAVDGREGPRTRAAIEKYAQDHDISAEQIKTMTADEFTAHVKATTQAKLEATQEQTSKVEAKKAAPAAPQETAEAKSPGREVPRSENTADASRWVENLPAVEGAVVLSSDIDDAQWERMFGAGAEMLSGELSNSYNTAAIGKTPGQTLDKTLDQNMALNSTDPRLQNVGLG